MRPSVLVGSYCWIGFFTEGPPAARYAPYVEAAGPKAHIAPSIILYEAYKKIRKGLGEERALEAYAHIVAYTNMIPLDEGLAAEAADASLFYGLSMADSMVKAAADKFAARLVTSDLHFKGIKGVVFIG